MLGFVHLLLVILVFSIRFQLIPGASGSSPLFWGLGACCLVWVHGADKRVIVLGALASDDLPLPPVPPRRAGERCTNRKLDELLGLLEKLNHP